MGSVLQFVAFLCICWLIRGVVTHPNHDEDKRSNNKHSNRNVPSNDGDFYFEEQNANDDNIKTGRPIPQSAWSKEDKEQTQSVENKTDAKFSDEFSFKSALSYLLNLLDELKKDVFGIKEMTTLKNSKVYSNSRDNSEDKVKQNKIEENSDTPKTDDSAKNTEFGEENQKPKSNYITEYYQNNGIIFIGDDLETSSEESDDSSHKPDEGTDMNEDICISECSKINEKPVKYSSGAEETTATLTSLTKIPEENAKKSHNTKDDDVKESTTKPLKMKQNNSKTSREENENITTATPSPNTGKCLKKNNNNSSNPKEENKPTKKPLKSTEYVTSNPQNKNFYKPKSEGSNQNKATDDLSKVTLPSSDSRRSGKKSKNNVDSSFDSKSGVLGQSTTLSSQSPKDVIYPENITNEPYASGMSSEKQQEKTTTLKPENQKQAGNNQKPLKNNDKATENTTVPLQSLRAGSKIHNHEKNTDTEIKDIPKESSKRSNVNSSHTTVTHNEDEQEPISKTEKQKTSNSFDTGNTISSTTSENIIKPENLNEGSSDDFNGQKGTNEYEKSHATEQGKNYLETQRNGETVPTETQLSNDDSEQQNSSKNSNLTDSTNENEKSNAAKHGKNDSKTQRNKETVPTETQQLNNDSEKEKSSKNKLTDSTNENEKSNATKHGKNDSVTQRNKETVPTETQQSNDDSEPLNNDSKPEKSSKNKLTDSTNENENSEKSNATNHDKNDSETQRNKETAPTETQQSNNDSEPLNNDSKPEKSSKSKLTDSTNENENSEKSNATKQDKNDSEIQKNKETVPTETQQTNDDSEPLNNDSKPEKSSKNKLTDSTNENENSEKSNATKQDKNDSETQRNKETVPTETKQSNDDSEPQNSLKNSKLTDSTNENEKSNATKHGKNDSKTQRNKEIVPTEKQQLNNDSEPEKSSKKKLTDSTNENENSEKSNATKQDENDSETQRNRETVPTETQQSNDDSEQQNSSKNSKFNDSNRENNNKDEVDNLASMTTNDSPSLQESNLKIKNQGAEGFDKQETQKIKGSRNESDGMRETSPDEDYEYEDDNDDFDISDELTDMKTDGDLNQKQEGKLNRNVEKNDEMNPDNRATVLTNEPQTSQHIGYVMEEKPQEQYNTFLEYFYKHSNNPIFLSLKNQSNNYSP